MLQAGKHMSAQVVQVKTPPSRLPGLSLPWFTGVWLKVPPLQLPIPPSRQLPQKSNSAFLKIQTCISRNSVLVVHRGGIYIPNKKEFCQASSPPLPTPAAQALCGQINSCQRQAKLPPPPFGRRKYSSIWKFEALGSKIFKKLLTKVVCTSSIFIIYRCLFC